MSIHPRLSCTYLSRCDYQVDKPVHIHGRSRLDTWNSAQLMAVIRPPVSHPPVHFLARSKLNTWQSKSNNASRRTKSVPVFTPPSFAIQPQARVDTWLRRRTQSVSTVRLVDKPLRVNGRSKIDSWSNTPIQRKRKSLSNPTIYPKIEAKSRIDTWLPTDYRPRQSIIAVRESSLCQSSISRTSCIFVLETNSSVHPDRCSTASGHLASGTGET